jgi:hypothetical protein
MITHVDAPLKTQVLEAAIDQFSELLDGRGSIRTADVRNAVRRSPAKPAGTSIIVSGW